MTNNTSCVSGPLTGPAKVSQGTQGLTPCTPLGCMMLIWQVTPDLTGMHAVVLGSSNVVGKPMAALLLEARATVAVADVHMPDAEHLEGRYGPSPLTFDHGLQSLQALIHDLLCVHQQFPR